MRRHQEPHLPVGRSGSRAASPAVGAAATQQSRSDAALDLRVLKPPHSVSSSLATPSDDRGSETESAPSVHGL